MVAVWPRRGTVPVPLSSNTQRASLQWVWVMGACWLSGRSNERPYVRVLFLVLVVVAVHKLVQQ